MKVKEVKILVINYLIIVYCLWIYGNIDEVLVKVICKQVVFWKSIVNWQVIGIQFEDDGIDDYYGFEIDGNCCFLFGDMMVIYNIVFILFIVKNVVLDFGKGVVVFSLEMLSLQLV